MFRWFTALVVVFALFIAQPVQAEVIEPSVVPVFGCSDADLCVEASFYFFSLAGLGTSVADEAPETFAPWEESPSSWWSLVQNVEAPSCLVVPPMESVEPTVPDAIMRESDCEAVLAPSVTIELASAVLDTPEEKGTAARPPAEPIAAPVVTLPLDWEIIAYEQKKPAVKGAVRKSSPKKVASVSRTSAVVTEDGAPQGRSTTNSLLLSDPEPVQNSSAPIGLIWGIVGGVIVFLVVIEGVYGGGLLSPIGRWLLRRIPPDIRSWIGRKTGLPVAPERYRYDYPTR